MHIKKQIDTLYGSEKNYWSERLYSQLDFLYEIAQVDTSFDTKLLEQIVEELTQTKLAVGCLGKAEVLAAESALLPYAETAKAYRLHMVSHAHIDMDWRWGFEETVSVVVDTFHTMLRLLDEYPDFIYTQSQASTYEIVEKYAPELLPAIRKHVKTGRWEVLCSSWVENDKNLTGTESAMRHMLYAKRYLSQLLGVDADKQEIDFEPDSFGHSRHLPELLSNGGVRYYYHCRGNDQEELYRWRADSGAELLVMRDPQWYYLRDMDYRICWHVPSFCARNHVKAALRFYGVGNHGGGPSRRDIERILDMQTWPLLPTMIFSRLHDFFHEIEPNRQLLPIIENEQNFVFTGCYSAQARLKQANRHGEDRLYDAEALCAMATAAGCDLTGMPSFEPAWRNILFNQFHDIVTGSCTREAKERALSRFQDTCAITLSNSKRAMREMGNLIATDAFPCDADPTSLAESGGHGYGSWKNNETHPVYCVNTQSNGGGRVRAYTIFNATAYDREELVELTLWDWPEPLEATAICDSNGNELPFEMGDTDKAYWHHTFSVIYFVAKVPAFGYCNYYVISTDQPANRTRYLEGPRVHRFSNAPIILENAFVKATFSSETMELLSLMDKATETEQITDPSAYFCLNEEESVMPYSAWTVGRIGKRENLNRSCFVKILGEQHSPFWHKVCYEIAFRNSRMKVSVSLPANASILRFSVEADWHEIGQEGGITPQLQFCVPFGYRSNIIRYDIPGGFIDRSPCYHDVPGGSYAAPVPVESRSGIFLTSDCKYSYYSEEGVLSITLLRSSINPDKYPELGIQSMELGLGVAESTDWKILTEKAICFAHPLYIYSNTIHAGLLPACSSLIRIEGRANVIALKRSEDRSGLTIRLGNHDENQSTVTIHLPKEAHAEQVDVFEKAKESYHHTNDMPLPAKSVQTLKLLWEMV